MSNISNSEQSFLRSHKIHKERAFLPKKSPCTCLPIEYQAWEEAAKELPYYLQAGKISSKIKNIPHLSPQFQDELEWERAMLLLSFLAHAFVHGGKQSYLPAAIAIPWAQVAQHLGRPPMGAHPSIVLHNWRLLDEKEGIKLGNLAPLMQFLGGMDESWFYLLTVEMEAVGAEAVRGVIKAKYAADFANENELQQALQMIITGLQNMIQTLGKMEQGCDPYIFYHRVRPFLASFEQIRYDGLGEKLRSYAGGSAAQSSLLQIIDAALGIQHQDQYAARFLKEMRQFMPPTHRLAIEQIEKQNQIMKQSQQATHLKQKIQEAKALLIEFRNMHLQIVAKYIIEPAHKSGKSTQGTGGTSPLRFLKQVRDDSRKS